MALLVLGATGCDTPANDVGMSPQTPEAVSIPAATTTYADVESTPEVSASLGDVSVPDDTPAPDGDATHTSGADALTADPSESLDASDAAGPSNSEASDTDDDSLDQEVIDGATQGAGLEADDTTDSGSDSGGLPTDCDGLAEDTLCDDGDLCTLEDACREGVCAGTLLDCSDKDPCTEDEACVQGTCTWTALPDDKVCDGANGCAFEGTCQQGACEPETPLCPTEDPCKTGACVDEVCVFESVPNFTLCNDEDACTVYDRCISGYCYGSPMNCKDGEPCTVDSCSQDTGECESELLEDCVPGTPADFATPDVNPYSASYELETTLASFTGKILVGIFHSPS
jgi:hypothetical protein